MGYISYFTYLLTYYVTHTGTSLVSSQPCRHFFSEKHHVGTLQEEKNLSNSAIFNSECTINRLSAGLRPGPLWELTALPKTPYLDPWDRKWIKTKWWNGKGGKRKGRKRTGSKTRCSCTFFQFQDVTYLINLPRLLSSRTFLLTLASRASSLGLSLGVKRFKYIGKLQQRLRTVRTDSHGYRLIFKNVTYVSVCGIWKDYLVSELRKCLRWIWTRTTGVILSET